MDRLLEVLEISMGIKSNEEEVSAMVQEVESYKEKHIFTEEYLTRSIRLDMYDYLLKYTKKGK